MFVRALKIQPPIDIREFGFLCVWHASNNRGSQKHGIGHPSRWYRVWIYKVTTSWVAKWKPSRNLKVFCYLWIERTYFIVLSFMLPVIKIHRRYTKPPINIEIKNPIWVEKPRSTRYLLQSMAIITIDIEEIIGFTI